MYTGLPPEILQFNSVSRHISVKMVHSTAQNKAFPPGIHVPSLTWFADDSNQEIDWPTQNKHIEFLIKSGLHGSTF